MRLKGVPPNVQGIGANIKLLGGVSMQSKEVMCGGRYMAGADPLVVFAAATSSEQMSIEVKWRNGTRSLVRGVKANRIYEIAETGAVPATASPKVQSRPLFEDASKLIAHTHHEDAFNDFERQPLLPKKLSQLGPGMAGANLDGDGWDDLVIGSGKGGPLAIYHNDARGGFNRLAGGVLDKPAQQDQAGIVVVADTDKNKSSVLVGTANYEEWPSGESGVSRYNLRTLSFDQPIIAGESRRTPRFNRYGW